MRLLDGHPQCHTIPHEFVASFHADAKLLEGADQAWEHLQDTKLQRRFEKGVRQSHRRLSGSSEAFPMVMPPSLQRHLFDTCLAAHPSPTPRNVLDCYMTSYFNAWLDNQNLYSPRSSGSQPSPRRSWRPRPRCRGLTRPTRTAASCRWCATQPAGTPRPVRETRNGGVTGRRPWTSGATR